MTKEPIEAKEMSVGLTIVVQTLVGIVCIMVGIPVGLGIGWLSEILVIKYLGVELTPFLANATLSTIVAGFCLISLPLVVISVTNKQTQEMPSLQEITLHSLKWTAIIGGMILCAPLFMAVYINEWEEFAFTLIVGSMVIGCIGVIISVVQVGQHWIDPDAYKKTKWLLSNEGALTMSHKGLLPFGFRLQNTWELILRSFLLLACIVLLPLQMTGNLVAEDDYQDHAMMDLALIGGIVIFPFAISETWYQLKRSNIYCIEGIVQKVYKQRWDGKKQYNIKVSGNVYKVNERMWKQLREGEPYRLCFAGWRFIFEQDELLAFEVKAA